MTEERHDSLVGEWAHITDISSALQTRFFLFKILLYIFVKGRVLVKVSIILVLIHGPGYKKLTYR